MLVETDEQVKGKMLAQFSKGHSTKMADNQPVNLCLARNL